MRNSQYLFDSNVVIDFLRKNELALMLLESESVTLIPISSITEAEVYQGARKKQEMRIFENFLETYCIVYQINSSISERATELVKTYTLSTGLLIADALIASTALYYNYTLLTGNVKHFRKIAGLSLKDWSEFIN